MGFLLPEREERIILGRKKGTHTSKMLLKHVYIFLGSILPDRNMLRSAGCIERPAVCVEDHGRIKSLLCQSLPLIFLSYTTISSGDRLFKNRNVIRMKLVREASCGNFDDSYLHLHFFNVSHRRIPNK